MKRRIGTILLGTAWVAMAACGDDPNPGEVTVDASNVIVMEAGSAQEAGITEAGAASPDGGVSNLDARVPTTDASGVDANGSGADAGASSDGSVPAADGAAPVGDAAAVVDAGPEPVHPGDQDKTILPIVFVHGYAGSASQFDSQAQRFVANGYPPNKLRAYDHDGAGALTGGFVPGLDQIVNGLLTEYGVTQVFLIGHSRGTGLVNDYVRDPGRAKKVSKIILLDGGGCPAGGIPCDTPRQSNLPGQAHVEVATSAESFKRQYKFLFGKDAAVVDIVAQAEPVRISGRAVNFPANTGRSGASLEVFELGANGQRPAAPLHKQMIDASGNFGPIGVSAEKYYEFALTLENGFVQHYYLQRFLRSTKFIRLLSGAVDSPSRTNTNAGANHAAITIMRMREWRTADALQIKVTRAAAAETSVPNAITSDISNDPIAIYLHDDKATPGMTTLKPLPYFPAQPFQNGLDVFMPAAETPDGTITVTSLPRGQAGKPQVLSAPNWASSKHSINLYFADYAQ